MSELHEIHTEHHHLIHDRKHDEEYRHIVEAANNEHETLAEDLNTPCASSSYAFLPPNISSENLRQIDDHTAGGIEEEEEDDVALERTDGEEMERAGDDMETEEEYYNYNVYPYVSSARSDWHYQLKQSSMDRQRRNVLYHSAMIEQGTLTLQNRRVAIHILVSEAYRHAQRTRSGKVSPAQWRTILNDAMDDMAFADNSALVMKNLSCMCIFVPGRQSQNYGDNPEDRSHRIQRHQSVLERLRVTNRLFLDAGEKA